MRFQHKCKTDQKWEHYRQTRRQRCRSGSRCCVQLFFPPVSPLQKTESCSRKTRSGTLLIKTLLHLRSLRPANHHDSSFTSILQPFLISICCGLIKVLNRGMKREGCCCCEWRAKKGGENPFLWTSLCDRQGLTDPINARKYQLLLHRVQITLSRKKGAILHAWDHLDYRFLVPLIDCYHLVCLFSTPKQDSSNKGGA